MFKLKIKSINRFKNIKEKTNRFLKNRIRNPIVSTCLSIKGLKKNQNNLPKSRLKRYAYGMGTTLTLFGLVFFSGPLVAFAKDLPADAKPKPTEVAPKPAPAMHPATTTRLSGAASMLCGLAVSSGSFAIGALCGAIVGVGILIAQGKIKIGRGK